MALNIFKWIMGATSSGDTSGTRVAVQDFLETEVGEGVAGLEIYLQRMAYWTCIRKIGSAVASCEFQTVRVGKQAKAKEYWAWNYAPNPNQTKEQFIVALIGELFTKQEALVVETANGYRYVANSFSTEKNLNGDIYRDVSSDGQSIPGTFGAGSVLHFTIEGDSIRQGLLALAAAEGRLIRSSANSFVRNQGMRGTLEIDEYAEADEDFEATYADLVNDKFKKYYTAEQAVLPLFKGYKYTERESQSGKAQQANTRDIRAMMDDIMELTARAIGMPVSVALGKGVTDADFKDFMTSLVKPLVNMIQQEINRKVYGMRQVLNQQTYIVVDMANVRYTDLFDVANPIDKLIGSGAFCINDIRLRLGLDIIDEPWAWQHWMTKNYSTVEDLNEGVDGNSNTQTTPAQEPEEGENNEQDNEDGE